MQLRVLFSFVFFFQAEDGIRDGRVTGVQTCALPILAVWGLVVSTMDNVLRLVLVGAGATMPLTFVFLGVFGGLAAFGFLGMFIGPTLLAILFAIFQSWRSSVRGGERCV